MMEKQTFILGGGIAGLIWSYYNDGIVISPEFGGQMSNHFPLGPRYLHDIPEARKFLLDIGLKIIPKKIVTGYLYNGEVLPEPPNAEFVEEYFFKSRGGIGTFDSTVMSSQKSSFDSLLVDFEKIIDKLIMHLGKRKIEDKIIGINLKNKTFILEKNGVKNYQKMVSTIPLNIFLKICSMPCSLQCQPITYTWLSSDYTRFPEWCDYIYAPEKKFVYHRLTKDSKGIIVDIFGHHTKEKMKEVFGKHFIDCQTLWNSQIISIDEIPKVDNVKFVGRYGTWNRKWKTEMVISEAIRNAE